MQLQNSRCGATLVVRVSERLDTVTAPTLEAHCQQLLAQGERNLTLDFATLDYLSSAGLRSILVVAKAMSAAGGQFALAQAQGVVREVLEVSGFLRMFRLLDSLDAPAAQP